MKKLTAVLFAVALLVTACGGTTSVITGEDGVAQPGSGDDNGSDTDSGSDGDNGSDTDSGSDGDNGSGDDSGSDGDNGSGDDSGSDGDNGSGDDNGSDGGGASFSGDFCALAAERESAQNDFENVNVFIPAEFEAAWKANVALLDRAVAGAPSEIKADLELIRSELRVINEVFATANYDISALFLEDPEADLDESPEAEAAGERVDDYVRNVCGIDPDANDDQGPTDDELLEDLQQSGNSEELVRVALESAGFAPAQAECLAKRITLDEFIGFTETEPPAEVLQIFQECGVDLATFGQLGGG